MLTIFGSRQPFCDGLSRRSFLKIGGLGMGGLALPGLLRARAASGTQGRPKAVIMVCLPGGPSHLEMYDMKPAAPAEVRGEFKPIHTNIPGFDICEHMPLQAKIADKLAIVRNLRFTQPDHQLHEVYTGFPAAPKAPLFSPPVKPSFGSIIARLRQQDRAMLPRYISLGLSDFPNTVGTSEDPLHLGPACRPFEPKGQGLRSLILTKDMTLERLDDRQKLRTSFDNLRRELDATGQMEAHDHFTAKALQMICSPEVRDALDVSREPAHVRELYGPDIKFKLEYQQGHTWYNSKFLLARRLVEAGVPVVTLAMGGWDDHGKVNAASPAGNLFERMREKLPVYDHTIHALVTDLHQRGLDKDVAVVVWGEFGRTPKVNFAGGRDHWPRASFALFFGGGFRTGQVIGRTNEHGQVPVGNSYTAQNVLATLYRHLSIDPDLATYPDPSGRPMHLLEDCNRIAEL